MERSKFLRALGALLMILAIVLPVAPVVASEDAPAAMDDQGVELQASHLSAGFDNAECARIVPDGQIKLFLTVQSNTGVDIPNGVGKVLARPPGNADPAQLTAFPMNNGDLEGRANDGNLPGGCTPALPDGHPNDMESPALDSGAAVSILLTAPGFVPRVITSFTLPGFGDVPIAVLADTALLGLLPTGCQLGDTSGCLISLGTFQLQPLAAPAQRGVVAGSVFTSTGQPLDGSVVVLVDASGQVHTRRSGTDCAGAPLPGTGFYCFSSSRAGSLVGNPVTGSQIPGFPFPSPNQGAVLDANGNPVASAFDGLGLPVGPATIGVVNNQPVNCPPAGAPANAACGFLISTVTVNVAAGTVTGQDIPLGNKFTPARAAVGAGAVGYVQNLTGRGVGGITVFACPGADVAGCGVAPVGFPAGVLPPTPTTLGTLTAVTTPDTGLWVMENLTPGVAYTFAIAGPGINPGTVSANQIVGANVRPVRIVGGVATTSITRTTGAAGTWIDPNWIVAQGGFPLQQPLPPTGAGSIRGQVTDSQGAPFTGPGAVAILWRRTDRKIVAATDAGPNVPTIPAFNRNVIQFPEPPVVRASPIDANGIYCFGAGCPALIAANLQPPLVPDEYLVTILDERALPACTAGFLAPAGGIPPAPCGMLPATSPPILLTANSIVPPVNFTLVPALAPGSPPPGPLGLGTVNVFGFAWDMSVPGGRPIQGLTVYAVPVGPAIPPPSFAGGLVPDIPTIAALNTTPIIFAGPPWVTGSGAVNGPILSSVRTPVPGGYVVPPFPNSDPTGRWEVDGLAFGQRYLLIVELPQGYNQCAPGMFDLDTNSQGITPLLSPFGGFSTVPSTVLRCVTDLGAVGVSGPTAGLAGALAGGVVVTTPWIYGGTFGFSAQNLEPIEPGEIDRRLEQVIPLVSNGGPPAAMGGVDIQTMEIYVTNAGPMRTIAEVRFYASDGKGSAAVLAGTQQADLVPGGGRAFRAPEMPGGFVGWAGIWTFDADGPAQIFGESSLVAVVNTSVRSAGDAMTESAGVSREEFVFPQAQTSLPLIYRNYGGTENKWSTLMTITNMGRAGNVVLQLTTADRTGRDDARRCQPCLITKYVNAGGQININFGADDDPDISMLPFTTFTATLTAGGPQAQIPGVLPGTVAPILTNGYVAQTIHFTQLGRMATSGRGMQRLGTSAGAGSPMGENTGGLFAPLVFNNSNRWDSGLVIAGAQTSGSQAAVLTVTFFKEDGEFVCDVSDRVSSSSPIWYLYLPALQCIPPNYRGTVAIRATQGSSSDAPFSSLAPTIYGVVQHVNYDRNAAMAYDMIGQSTAALRTDSLGELPCTSLGYVTCAWVADFKKSGSINAEGNIGMQTGIRIMNVDPLLTGAPAGVTINYIDSSGVIWSEGTEQFVVPPMGTHTVFPLYNGRLPDFFRGTARVTSAQNSIVVIANVVDYAINGRDAAGSYNAQYNSGRTY